MGLYSINRRASVIGGTGFGGRQQAPLIARGQMFAGYDIPPQEVAELYKLYTQTGGPSWINHTNWFANKTCATWYGLTVAGGRVTQIALQDNNLAGVTSFNPKPFAALTIFYAFINAALSMRFTVADIPSTVAGFLLYSTQSVITGALSDIPAPTTSFQCQTSGSLITGGSSPMAATKMYRMRINDNAATVASQNSIIERIYADRALFTNAAPELQMGGTNPDPTGIYRAANPPTTPLEMLFALVNDPNAEGFKKWTITY